VGSRSAVRAGAGVGVPDRRAVLCRAGARLCALPVDRVVETMRPLPVEPLRSAPPFVTGVAVIRGGAVPVVDAGRLLGAAASAATRYVTVRAGARTVAVAVDEVVGVTAIPESADLPPLIGAISADAVAHLGAVDADLLVVLESSRLVPDEVWAELAARGGEG
jgi:purine-binding chemotaxis protein CheW